MPSNIAYNTDMEFTFTPHAIIEMQERNIPLQLVLMMLNDPEQIVPEKKNRSSYQSEVTINGKLYILRAIIEPDGTVVTVYRTSKLGKYRSQE